MHLKLNKNINIFKIRILVRTLLDNYVKKLLVYF